MAVIGDICETSGEITIEWKIKDFSTLSKEVDSVYYSPTFYFSGASWNIGIYPNGESEHNSEGWIGLYMFRNSSGISINMDYSLGFKNSNGKTIPYVNYTAVFNRKNDGWGKIKAVQRLDIMDEECDIIISDILTIVCSLKNKEPILTNGSLFNRLQKVNYSLKEMFIKKKKTDCVLKVQGKQIHAHRMVLKTQSPVFAAMFNHDTKENQTGEISVSDIDKDAMDAIIEFMYTGDIDNPTTKNALSLYAAAEKYDVKDVKDIVSEFITQNLSVDWVCDVIKFAELYEDEKIRHQAKEFFKKNARQILKSEKWKIFARENPDISVELLGSLLVNVLPE